MPITNKVKTLALSGSYKMLGYATPPKQRVSAYPNAVWMGRPHSMKERHAWLYMHLVGTVWQCYAGGDPYDENVMTAFNSALIALDYPKFILIVKTP